VRPALLGVPVACLLASGLFGGCAEQPAAAPLRSLGSSGPAAFVCLGAPAGSLESYAKALGACSRQRTSTNDDYSIPHLYALVTQPHAGEVAVIDLTTEDEAVLDQDPTVPGSNFLPVGALPVDLVATPGGVASFVAVAEPNYEAIYGLPSSMIRGSETKRLSSWPACALPAAPGAITLALDAADDGGLVRPSCDAAYGDADPTAECEGVQHCHGDLGADANTAGAPGRYKLLVTLPAAGGIAVIDAQSILDREAGKRDACTIERWLPLDVDLPPPPDAATTPMGAACAVIDMPTGAVAQTFTPYPSGVAYDGERLYVADEGAPVIHRIDLPTPCDPRELQPLLATSVEDPTRIVYTSRVTVSPRTLDLRRFLYAIDVLDGSILTYDVTEGSGPLRPLERANAFEFPFQPSDRIRFGVPPRDIVLLEHQNDEVDATTGATLPVRCDPDPMSTGPGTKYRTLPSLSGGAGPTRLRGVFAFAVLTSGDIVVIDVDDYDAPCRGPTDQSAVRGCEEPFLTDLATSNEYSCNVVVPNAPRSAKYLQAADADQRLEPGITSFPLLFDEAGTVVQLAENVDTSPRMRATQPAVELGVGTTLHPLDSSTGLPTDEENEHALQMSFLQPRAHIFDQTWSVTFEGRIPGFDGHFFEVTTASGDELELRDPTAALCGLGVQSQTAVELVLTDRAEDPALARDLADYVQIVSDTPVDKDDYWKQQADCTFQQCDQTYGSSATPRATRDYRVLEATSETLLVEPRGNAAEPGLKCCFPNVVEIGVRAGNQWVVLGDRIGFLHAMKADASGVCRPSCELEDTLLVSRVRETAPDVEEVPSVAIDPMPATLLANPFPQAFQNPFFRFAINAPAEGASVRGMSFRFSTVNSFQTLVMTVVTETNDVQPTSARYLTPTGELVVSDGSLEGITLLDLNALTINRQYH
jgi:hypothetical protein